MKELMNEVLLKARTIYQMAVDNDLENTQDYINYQDELNRLSIVSSSDSTKEKWAQTAPPPKFLKKVNKLFGGWEKKYYLCSVEDERRIWEDSVIKFVKLNIS